MKKNQPMDDTYRNHVPARTVITRSGAIVRGKFPSRKNNRMVRHEGLLERDAILLFEMNPCIVQFREQPFKIDYPFDAKIRKYTPDFELLLQNGEKVLVEIKHSDFLARSDINEKFECIQQWFRYQNFPYLILTEKALRAEPRKSNLQRGYYSLTKHSRNIEHLTVILERLDYLGACSVKVFNKYVAPLGTNVFDFLVAGLITCDVDSEITDDSIVNMNMEVGNEWFRICKEYSF